MIDSADEEHLAELLGELREPPRAWIEAAKQLPSLSVEIDDLVRHAADNPDFRKRLEENMNEALRDAGHTPTPQLVGALRARLSS